MSTSIWQGARRCSDAVDVNNGEKDNFVWVCRSFRDHLERARALLEASLAYLCAEWESYSTALCLAALAGVVGQQGRADWAVRLFGAVEAVFAHLHAAPGRAHRLEIERNLAAAHAQLDEATFAAAWAEGQAMTLEQAVAYALEDLS